MGFPRTLFLTVEENCRFIDKLIIPPGHGSVKAGDGGKAGENLCGSGEPEGKRCRFLLDLTVHIPGAVC